MMQVPLGILPKNEVSYDDMLDVFNMLSRGGGSAYGSQSKRCSTDLGEHSFKLDGLYCHAHAKVCLMEVCICKRALSFG